MKVILSGSTGLVGSALSVYLTSKGHSVKSLVRHAAEHPSQIHWNPPNEGPDPAALEGADAIIHLAGESIASGRWTPGRKRAILDSRQIGTRLISETLLQMNQTPRIFLCASAIGFYGDRGEEILTEKSASGNDFLADVCKKWEAETQPATQKGIRVVNLRFGVILSKEGGALAKMLIPFRCGLGGVVGPGSQWMSWIALQDVLGSVAFALDHPTLKGPVNIVSPHPVTNREFTRALGKVLRRPAVFPMPAFAARLAFGEMADALLLSSARVMPQVLSNAGYHFQGAQLEDALYHIVY